MTKNEIRKRSVSRGCVIIQRIRRGDHLCEMERTRKGGKELTRVGGGKVTRELRKSIPICGTNEISSKINNGKSKGMVMKHEKTKENKQPKDLKTTGKKKRPIT